MPPMSVPSLHFSAHLPQRLQLQVSRVMAAEDTLLRDSPSCSTSLATRGGAFLYCCISSQTFMQERHSHCMHRPASALAPGAR